MARQYSAMRSISKAMWPPMWTTTAAFGFSSSALRSKSSNETQRSSRLQSTKATLPPACWIASGVAMKVLEGQSTVSPSIPAQRRAASAPPVQPPKATAPVPFQSPQASSKREVSSPSDQRLESMIPSHSSCRRGRSRRSKPILNEEKSGMRMWVTAPFWQPNASGTIVGAEATSCLHAVVVCAKWGRGSAWEKGKRPFSRKAWRDMALRRDKRSGPRKALDAVTEGAGEALQRARGAADELGGSVSKATKPLAENAKQLGSQLDKSLPGSPAAKVGAGIGAVAAAGAGAAVALRKRSGAGSSPTKATPPKPDPGAPKAKAVSDPVPDKAPVEDPAGPGPRQAQRRRSRRQGRGAEQAEARAARSPRRRSLPARSPRRRRRLRRSRRPRSRRRSPTRPPRREDIRRSMGR